ncbi:ester cyclase [Aestuariivivens sediminis]|uniref:ester cyclase n=1 Tax=Aestuariivivens sediminis TaxID=2913557 RepID=UPI001F564CF5|nr:ester cyclase [Aestuariivivens sediminis]
MHRELRYAILLGIAMANSITSCRQENDHSELSKNVSIETKVVELNPDEEKIKTTIKELLFAAGNYNIAELETMISDKAMLGISSLKDGVWSNSEIAINDFFESVKHRERRPYCEIPNNFDILITEGQVALARADCTLHRWGIPQTSEVNHFTLIKDHGKWKVLHISWTKVALSEDQKNYDLDIFARGYAQAWCSQRPNFVSSFFAEDGELVVNNGKPAIGTAAITHVAQGFMEAFPDMIVSLDSLTTNKAKTKFHWTLTGTNAGPNGTGNKVNINGFEEWTLNDDGLIQKSKGHFDEKEYKRQLEFGADK